MNPWVLGLIICLLWIMAGAAGIYVASRLISIAYFRSKLEYHYVMARHNGSQSEPTKPGIKA